jgi:transposase
MTRPPSISRAYLLKEELRALYHLEARTAASEHLRAWLAWASRSRFVKLARTIRRYRAASSPPSAWALQRPP